MNESSQPRDYAAGLLVVAISLTAVVLALFGFRELSNGAVVEGGLAFASALVLASTAIGNLISISGHKWVGR